MYKMYLDGTKRNSAVFSFVYLTITFVYNERHDEVFFKFIHSLGKIRK